MKKLLILIVLAAVILSEGNAQSPTGYTQKSAYELLNKVDPAPFIRNTDPGAQWFPGAGAGLFIHWGIHSVAGLNPSWAMIKNLYWVKRDCPIAPEDYYRLAEEFDPVAYDPEKWVLAAKQAGFQYVVMTAKHHDGYCLWPSKFGEWNTGKYMQGRDLLRLYVDACRKHGLKVGFYYSPRDWADPDYANVFPFVNYDLKLNGTRPKLPPEQNQKLFDHFFMTITGQLSELLTRYGQIDLLWLDGVGWPGANTYPDKMHAWFRALQPSMVVNPRWESADGKPFGDYKAEEDSWRGSLTESPEDVHDGDWWEFCESWSGHWGYSPLDPYRSADQVIKHLVYARSFGGNLLLNIGPSGDGTMRKGYYTECSVLAAWMNKNKESVIGTQAVRNWKTYGQYPMTKRDNYFFVHLLTDTVRTLEINGMEKPVRAVFLETGEELGLKYGRGKNLQIDLLKARSHPLDAVIRLEYND